MVKFAFISLFVFFAVASASPCTPGDGGDSPSPPYSPPDNGGGSPPDNGGGSPPYSPPGTAPVPGKPGSCGVCCESSGSGLLDSILDGLGLHEPLNEVLDALISQGRCASDCKASKVTHICKTGGLASSCRKVHN